MPLYFCVSNYWCFWSTFSIDNVNTVLIYCGSNLIPLKSWDYSDNHKSVVWSSYTIRTTRNHRHILSRNQEGEKKNSLGAQIPKASIFFICHRVLMRSLPSLQAKCSQPWKQKTKKTRNCLRCWSHRLSHTHTLTSISIVQYDIRQ